MSNKAVSVFFVFFLIGSLGQRPAGNRQYVSVAGCLAGTVVSFLFSLPVPWGWPFGRGERSLFSELQNHQPEGMATG